MMLVPLLMIKEAVNLVAGIIALALVPRGALGANAPPRLLLEFADAPSVLRHLARLVMLMKADAMHCDPATPFDDLLAPRRVALPTPIAAQPPGCGNRHGFTCRTWAPATAASW
jgi:hypothetical protein